MTSCGAKLIAIQQSFAESDFEVFGVEQPEPIFEQPAPLQFPKTDPDSLIASLTNVEEEIYEVEMSDEELDAWHENAVKEGVENGLLVRNISGKLLGVGEHYRANGNYKMAYQVTKTPVTDYITTTPLANEAGRIGKIVDKTGKIQDGINIVSEIGPIKADLGKVGIDDWIGKGNEGVTLSELDKIYESKFVELFGKEMKYPNNILTKSEYIKLEKAYQDSLSDEQKAADTIYHPSSTNENIKAIDEKARKSIVSFVEVGGKLNNDTIPVANRDEIDKAIKNGQGKGLVQEVVEKTQGLKQLKDFYDNW